MRLSYPYADRQAVTNSESGRSIVIFTHSNMVNECAETMNTSRRQNPSTDNAVWLSEHSGVAGTACREGCSMKDGRSDECVAAAVQASVCVSVSVSKTCEMTCKAPSEVGADSARRGSSMTSQCEFGSGNYLFSLIAADTCSTATYCVKLSSPRSTGLQRKRTEYSTVSPKWEGRGCIVKSKANTVRAGNRQDRAASPVSCRLHGMKAMGGNSGDRAVSFPEQSCCIKRLGAGRQDCEGGEVALPISASEMEGDALCEVGGVRGTDDSVCSTNTREGRHPALDMLEMYTGVFYSPARGYED